LDLSSYARALHRYVDGLGAYAKEVSAPNTLDLTPLRKSSDLFAREAQTFHLFDANGHDFGFGAGAGFESSAMSAARVDHNRRMMHFETDLLDLSEGGGLVNRTQFKHVVFAPQAWSGYDEAYFPGVRDAIDAGQWDEAQHQVQKVADILEAAARKLNA